MFKHIRAWAMAYKARQEAIKQQEWVILQHDNDVAVVVAEKIRRGDSLNVREINWGFKYDTITIQEIPCNDSGDSWTEYWLKINDDQINASEHILKDIYLLCKRIHQVNTEDRIKVALDAVQ